MAHYINNSSKETVRLKLNSRNFLGILQPARNPAGILDDRRLNFFQVCPHIFLTAVCPPPLFFTFPKVLENNRFHLTGVKNGHISAPWI